MAGPPRLGQETLANRRTFALGRSTALCAGNLAALGLAVGIVGRVGEDVFGYLAGWSRADCATWANACGAMTVGRPGRSGAFASRREVEAYIRSTKGAAD